LSILFGIVAPVFALIVMGLASTRLRLLDAGGLRGMTGFVFYAAMPALLFSSMTQAPPLRLVDVAGTFLAGALALFAVAVAVALRLLRLKLPEASLFALNSVFGNTMMLGVPIVDAAYGAEGVANLLAVVVFHSAVLLPLATLLLESGRGGRSLRGVLYAALAGVAQNPVVVSIFAAFLWRATGVAVPAPVLRWLDLLGAAGPPLALFCLGASLPRPRGWSDMAEISIASVLKLVAMPALVAVLAHLAGVGGVAFAVVVIAAGLPTGANAFLLARRFSTMAEASAGVVLVSTGVSLLTITLLLGWLQ
jgi:malonate transporter and related proteins